MPVTDPADNADIQPLAGAALDGSSLAGSITGDDMAKPSPTHGAAPAHAGSFGRIVRNSGINVIGTVLNLVLSFVAVFLLARRLGPDTVGLYFTLFTIALVVYFILESGITTVLTRRIAREPARLKKHVAEANGLLLVVSLLSIIVMTLIGFGWDVWESLFGRAIGQAEELEGMRLAPLCVAAGVACAGRLVLEFYAAIFRGLERFEYENLARVIQAGIFAGLVWAFVSPPDISAMYISVGILVASNVLSALYIVVALQRGWKCLGFRLNRQVLADWLPESLPLGVGDLIQRITWNVDTILLGWLQPLGVVGLYSVAYRPLQPLNLVPRTVLSVTFPHFSRLADADLPALGRAFAASIRLLWIVSLPLSIGICAIAEPLVVLSAGPKFSQAVTPLRLLIWIVNLSFISTQFRFLFTALGKQRLFTRLVFPILILKTVAELALIPWLGYYGACAGSVLAELTLVASGLYVCRQLGLGGLEWGLMARALPAAAIMAALIWPARDAAWLLLAATTCVASLVYLGLCLLFGTVERSELARFAGTIKTMLHARRQKRLARLSAEGGPAGE
jgi:stage V sporulation protein B